MLMATSLIAQPVVPFFDGFENGDLGTFNSYNSTYTITGTSGGVSPATGSYMAVVDSSTASPTGVYTYFGGKADEFGGGFTGSMDIYVDVTDSGYAFDLSFAATKQDNNHLRDFIFHVGMVNGSMLVTGSNNTDAVFNPYLLTNPDSNNSYTIGASGWYTFQADFYDHGDGTLAVDLNLINSAGGLLWTETRNTSADLISTIVGGNRYGWFTFIDTDALAIDNVTMVPEPATMGLLSLGALVLRRKRK